MYANDPMNLDLVTRVALSFSCKDLIKLGLTSKSDPLVQVKLLQNDKWVEIGRTERIKNTLNPQFVKSVIVDYRFEESQKMRIKVFDVDNDGVELYDADPLGNLECNLGNIVSKRVYTAELQPPGRGSITIIAEELRTTNTEVKLHFYGCHLDKKDVLGKSDPFLEIIKVIGESNSTPVHRTPHIMNSLDPKWEPFHINVEKLCNSDYDMKLKVNCFDYDNDGEHDFIGAFDTTLGKMLQASSSSLQWELINPKKQAKKKGYKNSGIIVLNSINLNSQYSFLDFVMSGCRINFSVGIDFTGSNGKPTNPTSLHYISDNEPNEYTKSLLTVGGICQDYDSDLRFPAFGFGARIPPDNEISFNFALNFDEGNPYCHGISGVVAAYQNCLRKIKFSGPTNVAPIVNHVARFTKSMIADNELVASHYFILLLLTDGEITDMNNTVDAIVSASFLPMSLIIIGVGDADFTAMNFLDGDDGLLKSTKDVVAYRDIVQFVPFRDFKKSSPAELAKHVLAEVPKQVVEYFKLKGIKPTQ